MDFLWECFGNVASLNPLAERYGSIQELTEERDGIYFRLDVLTECFRARVCVCVCVLAEALCVCVLEHVCVSNVNSRGEVVISCILRRLVL